MTNSFSIIMVIKKKLHIIDKIHINYIRQRTRNKQEKAAITTEIPVVVLLSVIMLRPQLQRAKGRHRHQIVSVALADDKKVHTIDSKW